MKEIDCNAYVGLTLIEAMSRAGAELLDWRIWSSVNDGKEEWVIATADLRADRVNFSLVDGIVTKCDVG